MKYIILFCLLFCFQSTVFGFQKQLTEKPIWTLSEVEKSIDYCATKTKATIVSLNGFDKSPRTIPATEKHWNAKSGGGWTAGFWPGILWYVYEGTGDISMKLAAEKFTEKIEPVVYETVKGHDLGFIFYCSYGNGYRLTGNQAYKKILLTAADSLTHLYNKKVGTILSWPVQVKNKVYAPHNTIIDNMMNLELLFFAGKNATNSRYNAIAISHANVTQKNQIRSDATIYHVVVYDDKTGEVIRKCTHQGYADNSVWSRGQAWAIYGYAMCYRETGNVQYLKTAKDLLGAYLKRLPTDGVPFWDFDDPAIPAAPKDASAAAVVASALLEMSTQNVSVSEKKQYRSLAEKMLWTLSSPAYLSNDTNDAFLLHSTGSKPKNVEVDIPIIYADYYYIEALVRLKKILLAENKKHVE